MKKISVIIQLVLYFSTMSDLSLGQNATFNFNYSTLWDEVPTHSIETPDGGFIISAKQGTMAPYSSHVLLIKLNQWGDTIKTVTINKNSGNCFIYQLLSSDDGNYFATGTWQQSPAEMNFWLVKLNSNLDILWEKKYATGCYNLDIALGLIDHSHTLVIYGNGYLNPVPTNGLLLYRCNQNGDSLIGTRLIQPSYHAIVYHMVEKTDSSGFYMAIEGRFAKNTYSWGQILKFDTSLNIVQTDSIPRSLFHYYNLQTANGKIFLTGNKTYPGSNPYTKKLGLLQLDTTFAVTKERYIGPDDTICYPGYIHNLTKTGMQNLYYGGTLNQDNNLVMSAKKTWFILGKYDTDLNVKWQKYYGGDTNYGLWSLQATSDGGCLMAGSTFDYLTQNNERDINILKVDSVGIITGVTLNKIPLMHDVLIYPNPGTDYLIVESGPQISGANLIMSNINGKQVLNTSIPGTRIKINTESIAPGTYLWQIIYKNQVLETGKWIKHRGQK